MRGDGDALSAVRAVGSFGSLGDRDRHCPTPRAQRHARSDGTSASTSSAASERIHRPRAPRRGPEHGRRSAGRRASATSGRRSSRWLVDLLLLLAAGAARPTPRARRQQQRRSARGGGGFHSVRSLLWCHPTTAARAGARRSGSGRTARSRRWKGSGTAAWAPGFLSSYGSKPCCTRSPRPLEETECWANGADAATATATFAPLKRPGSAAGSSTWRRTARRERVERAQQLVQLGIDARERVERRDDDREEADQPDDDELRHEPEAEPDDEQRRDDRDRDRLRGDQQRVTARRSAARDASRREREPGAPATGSRAAPPGRDHEVVPQQRAVRRTAPRRPRGGGQQQRVDRPSSAYSCHAPRAARADRSARAVR